MEFLVGIPWVQDGLSIYKTTEGWGWKKFLDAHLTGRLVQRHAHIYKDDINAYTMNATDNRWIQYGNILDYNEDGPVRSETIPWKSSQFRIDAKCECMGSAKWSKYWREDPHHYCVVHADYR